MRFEYELGDSKKNADNEVTETVESEVIEDEDEVDFESANKMSDDELFALLDSSSVDVPTVKVKLFLKKGD